MILLLIVIILFIFYAGLIIYYWIYWRRIPIINVPGKASGKKVSIIIPVRNEERNIGALLVALKRQTYPADLYEIIVVDDHSTDKTVAIVTQYADVNLIQLKEDDINSYKKKAIETGINAATGELIITTDGDCLPGKEWINMIATFQQEKDAAFVAAPVLLKANNSFLQLFQSMDFLVLQGITGASVNQQFHSMCNGANLAYLRAAFFDVEGFKGINDIASGDDMLLMHKISKRYPDKIRYLKSQTAIVSTLPQLTWKDFFNQRFRWASKAARYDDKRILMVLLIVYFFNVAMLTLLIAGAWSTKYLIAFGAGWVLKTIVELPFFISVAGFFNEKRMIKYFFFFQPLHIFYTVISGFFGQLGKYQWKGRKVK